jgi:hypothetical protein
MLGYRHIYALWGGRIPTRRDSEVASAEKVLARLLSGRADKNIAFGELCSLLRTMRFKERIKGDHHIFARQGIAEIINLQPLRDGKAKPYQVKQVRGILNAYGLTQIP